MSGSGLNYASFVHPEPPEDPEDVAALFVNREEEQAFALRQLLSVVARPRNKILAIYGKARVGKSHFLRRLVSDPDLCLEFHSIVVLKPAQGADEQAVMRMALQELYVHVQTRATQPIADKLGPVTDLLSSYGPAIGGIAAKVQISVKRKIVERLQSAVSGNAKLSMKLAGLIPALAGVDLGGELSGQASRTTDRATETEHGYQVEVQPLTDQALAMLAGLTHDLVRLADPGWRTLLVIDDFDLLGRTQDGAPNPLPLLDSLFQLAQHTGLYVLTTVREDTFGIRDKNFLEVAEIKPLTEASDLREIYDRHVRRFHEERSPFQDPFVDAAIVGSAGRPGMFLEVLDRAYRHARGQPQALSYDEYLGSLWRDYAQDHPAAAAAIRADMRSGRELLDDKTVSLIRDTSLWRCVLEEYTSRTGVILKPYFASYLKRLAQ